MLAACSIVSTLVMEVAMSRTRRRLPIGRPRSVKLYTPCFYSSSRLCDGGPVLVPFKQEMGRDLWKTLTEEQRQQEWKSWIPGQYTERDANMFALMVHRAIYRNDTCRRQRINGVRLSKRIDRHERRLCFKRELQALVREWETGDSG